MFPFQKFSYFHSGQKWEVVTVGEPKVPDLKKLYMLITHDLITFILIKLYIYNTIINCLGDHIKISNNLSIIN